MSTATADQHHDTTSTGAGGHRFSLTAAADATSTSKRTLLRHIDDLTRHGATRDDTGAWSIPLAALLAAGFTVGAPRTGDTDHQAPERAPGRAPDDTDLAAELTALRAALIDAEHRAELAEAQRSAALQLAAERAAHVDSLRLALRALHAAPQPAAVTAAPPDDNHPRRWWRRLIPAARTAKCP